MGDCVQSYVLTPSPPTPPVACCRDTSKPRMIQHKNEAKTFYRFLSIVYDHIVNPGHWTIDMRNDALEPAQLDDPSLKARISPHAQMLTSNKSAVFQTCLHYAAYACVHANHGLHDARHIYMHGMLWAVCKLAVMCYATCTPEPGVLISRLARAGGGRRRRDGLLHAGRRPEHTAAERDADRPVAAPAGQSAPQGGPAGRDHFGGACAGTLSLLCELLAPVETLCSLRISRHLRNQYIAALQGDAEDLPFPTDSFDRYVSAGSIGASSVLRHARAAV